MSPWSPPDDGKWDSGTHGQLTARDEEVEIREATGGGYRASVSSLWIRTGFLPWLSPAWGPSPWAWPAAPPTSPVPSSPLPPALQL